jgi:pimeloyl-ACP methyl ester carboxylesterase
MPKISSPMLVVWGDTDSFTPLDGPVGQYFKGLAGIRENTDFLLLQDVGHCPQDDRPEMLHKELLPWLRETLAAAPAISG